MTELRSIVATQKGVEELEQAPGCLTKKIPGDIKQRLA